MELTMTEEHLQPLAYRMVRYAPDLARDEWINCGVLLYAPERNLLEARCLREESEFARVRRLHPGADVELLRSLDAELTMRLAGFHADVAGHVEKLHDVLSNLIQLGPQRAVLAADAGEELARLYAEYVAPPRRTRPAAAEDSDVASTIRRQAHAIFAQAGILHALRPARAADYTLPGDTLRLDFTYRRNGTHGFIQAISLQRDPAHAKAFAFTAERIHGKVPHAKLTAITAALPDPRNERHMFVRALLEDQQVELVPMAQLEPWARHLAASLQ
jgi:hypothetical protein